MRTTHRLLPGEAWRSFTVKTVGPSPAMLAFKEWAACEGLEYEWTPLDPVVLPCAPGESSCRDPAAHESESHVAPAEEKAHEADHLLAAWLEKGEQHVGPEDKEQPE